jgi:hypothetical protein
MPASPEMIAVKETLASQVFFFEEVTGIDIGFRDEGAADAEDLAVRIFVRDAQSVSSLLNETLAQVSVPLVVLQRSFRSLATLPDTGKYRPLMGGVSASTSRMGINGFHVGTLGALAVTTETEQPMLVGLSNHHVLAFDSNRAFGDEIIQPEPGPFGVLPSDRVGTLASWAYPELVFEGTSDAAICTIEVPALAEISEVGSTAGTAVESIGMQVSKRGRTTGLTRGIVVTENDSLRGSYLVDCPGFPPVNHPFTGQPTTLRKLTNQFLIKPDFILSVFFSDHGDSGSVIVDTGNRIVGLMHGGGYSDEHSPHEVTVATPISIVEQDLRISLTQPL